MNTGLLDAIGQPFLPSMIHDYVNREPIGQHQESVPIVSGIFNNRPPQPRYIFVWSVKSVSNYTKILYKVKKL